MRKRNQNDLRSHQELIARRTLKMNSVMAAVMAGPTPEEAEQTLRTVFHYTDEDIQKLKGE